MAEHYHVQEENTLQHMCADAFVIGNKREAVRLLPLIIQPAAVRTDNLYTSVSLLHWAAYGTTGGRTLYVT